MDDTLDKADAALDNIVAFTADLRAISTALRNALVKR